MRRVLILFIALAGLSVLTVNAQSLYSIELQHRSASSLIPLIEPLLDEQETISGQNSLLLLKTNSTRYQELRKIIQQLDAPAKQLLIEIKSPRDLSRDSSHQQSNIVITNRGDSRITHSSRNTISTRSNHPVHSIRVIDGHSASLEDGKLVPLLSESFRFGLDPAHQGIALSYFKTASTISVTPRLHGNSVTLEITPHYSVLDQESNSEIRLQSSSTTIVVPLNQWTSLGGVTQESEKQSHNSFSTRSDNSETQVRVSILP